ncbi:MAG: hypothetical protein HN929_12070 [Chloroflexi bacterium]|jgi:restriction endonuclease S subunit|nr:hypothetical protein [Chloroflexota bacterium]MBT7082176.1 hypothetical protein [Chloroflexota bacterium]MBT7288983.1 hypothetical protein [Chloroflexota bacterium]
MPQTANQFNAHEQDVLPNGWSLKQLDHILDIRNGYAFKSKDFQKSGVLLIRQSNLTAKGISTNQAMHLPNDYLSRYSGYFIKNGDILIGMSGSIGRLSRYDLKQPALQNQRTGLIKFLVPEYAEYATYYLMYIENELIALAKGEAIKNISAHQIKSCLIPLPPADQAKLIAAKTKSLLAPQQRAEEKLKRAEIDLYHYKKAVLHQALNNNPDVKRVKLGKVASVRHGYSLPYNIATVGGNHIPFFKVADLAQVDISETPYLNNAKLHVPIDTNTNTRLRPLQAGSIVFAKTGEAIKLNRRAILNVPSLIDNNMMGVKSTSDRLDNTYLYYFLLSLSLEEVGRATTIPSIRKSDVEGILIPLPPLPEQLRIVTEIKRCYNLSDTLRKQLNHNLEQAKLLKQSILKQAFNGRLLN